MLKIKFLLIGLNFIVWSAYAQVETANSTYLALYKYQLPFFQELITGGLYSEASSSFEGHPFYNGRTFEQGTLSINQITYTEVPLLYDTRSDLVVTFHPVHSQKILIKSGKVDQFQLADGSTFRNFKRGDSYLYHRNGFYKVAYDKEIKVLVKHYKTVAKANEIGKKAYRYVSDQDYFLYHEGEFAPIKRKKQAAESLGLSKKEARVFMRGKGIVFKESPEKYLVELVQLRERNPMDFKGFAK